ncbi:MAG TPA: prolyl oligopeptidase family serine peptidase, partial [Solirubrobacteraceae bacterium]
VRLAAGLDFRIRTCVWTKAPAQAPASVCEEADTRPNALTGLTGVAAPTARMTVDRPAAGQRPATVAAVVLVDVLGRDGQYLAVASSWPAAGLPAAGIAVPAVDQAAGPVLGPQGVAIAGVGGGGINTGTQDSICREDQVAADTPDDGSTTALGGLPFAYEVGEPTAGEPVRGTMILLHGGAWFSVGRAKLSLTREDAARWRARGWRTVNATYRACAASVGDVLALYDRVAGRYGTAQPICAFGRSAGGQLALLLAARRPRLDCVVAEAGIADLPALARETTATGRLGPATVTNWATAAFGADQLAGVSAAGSPVHARVLYAIGVADTLVPWRQATDFARAQHRRDPQAYVDLLHVPAGDQPFEHAYVSTAGLAEFHAREDALVAPLTIGSVTAPASARLRSVRARGLRVAFTCASACKISARLELGATTARRLGIPRIAGRGSARRGSGGRGTLTIRLTAHAHKRLDRGTAQILSDVSAGGLRRHQTADVALRRP